MNFGKVAALTVLLVGSLALDTLATAQELFGVHVIAVNRFHSPVEITEFIFGKGDNSLRGPKIVVANHSKKVVTGYGLELVYLASQGCTVKGTPDAPYSFLEIDETGASGDLGRSRQLASGQSAEHRLNVRPEQPFSFLRGNQSAYFPLNLKTGYLHVQVKVTGVSFADNSSWHEPNPKPGSDWEESLYDHATYDGDRLDCTRWKPVMDKLNENMRWTDVTVESPKKLEQLGAGVVESSRSGSAEFLYTCAFTESEAFIKSPKRAAFVCPDLSK